MAMEAVTSCGAGAGQVQALGGMLSALVVQTRSVQAVRAAHALPGGLRRSSPGRGVIFGDPQSCSKYLK
jgi:hypothetical protein